MVEPLSLIKSFKTAQTLTKYIESGHIVENIVGDITLKAAVDSLINAKDSGSTTNCVNHVWSAINHLETSLSAHTTITDSHTKADSYIVAKQARYDLARNKGRYVCCLLAICYVYVGDKGLAHSKLDKAISLGKDRYQSDSIRGMLGDLALKVATGAPQATLLAFTGGGSLRKITSDPFYDEYLHGISDTDIQELRSQF